MPINELYNKNYTEFNTTYQLVLPLNYEVLIPEDDLVRLLIQISEGLNYDKLYKSYSSNGRKPAVKPVKRTFRAEKGKINRCNNEIIILEQDNHLLSINTLEVV